MNARIRSSRGLHALRNRAGRIDYCARKCAGGWRNVRSKFAANTVTAASSQMADKGSAFSAWLIVGSHPYP